MFLNRSRLRGPDPLLEARMALFVAGALMGFIGILRDGEGWWVPTAIGLLAAGMVLSMAQSVQRRRMERAEADLEEGEGESRAPEDLRT
jgi:hypothetical protein